jgi:ABC-type branched-subunit amino acid transport system substrate-binding protein
VQEYRKALSAWSLTTSPTFGSLEGYVITRILRKAIEAIPGAPTREAIVDALENLGEFDMGLGERLRLSAQEHQACHRVWPTILKGGKLVPFDWRELAGRPEGRGL